VGTRLELRDTRIRDRRVTQLLMTQLGSVRLGRGTTRTYATATATGATDTNATRTDATHNDAAQLRTHDKADHITQRTPLTLVDLDAHGTPHCRTRWPDTNSTPLDSTERDVCEALRERNWNRRDWNFDTQPTRLERNSLGFKAASRPAIRWNTEARAARFKV